MYEGLAKLWMQAVEEIGETLQKYLSPRERRDEVLNFLRILRNIKKSKDPCKACEEAVQTTNRRATRLEGAMWKGMGEYEVLVQSLEETLNRWKERTKPKPKTAGKPKNQAGEKGEANGKREGSKREVGRGIF